MTAEELAILRRDYKQEALNENQVDSNPIIQFGDWFDAAIHAGVADANAMALATATSNGIPSVRIVLLKGYSEEGFTFFTNYESRKGHELIKNPFAALSFYWNILDRQIRIEGHVKKVSEKDSDEYFNIRPLGSRIAAVASPQSHKISHEELLSRYHDLEAQSNASEIHRPNNWGGFIIIPQKMEFWQGRPNRLHDRIEYAKENNVWRHYRIAP